MWPLYKHTGLCSISERESENEIKMDSVFSRASFIVSEWNPGARMRRRHSGQSPVLPRARRHGGKRTKRERNVLFNDALNTFYFRLYGVRHMVKDHSDSERGNPLPPHRLLLSINSKGSFICTIPQTG